ncbi:TonB-dependent siderophore receptor [Comamonas nitrativorans]|uniref:TonB-dependent siderophore receptor n=1 Tax=Comamonas nitrativorans TaxID=108437 RepID=A0ABV9GYJ1_9BURK
MALQPSSPHSLPPLGFSHLPRLQPLHAVAQAVLAAVVVTSLATAAALPRTAHAQPAARAEAQHPFQIPAGPLAAALTAFAADAGVSVSAPPALVQGKHTAGLQGRYTVREALERLLADSNLQADAVGQGGYVLRAVPEVHVGNAAAGATLAEVRVTALAESSGVTEGTGSYTTPSSNSTTRLDLELQKTPQSVTIITRQQMDDQGLQEIAEVLRQAPGIAVNRDNTEGYSFYARGFRVENFQFDGIPSLSSAGGNVRDNYSLTDSAIYDRVEILKGATGLVNGVGEPSGVINLVRKRPTENFQGHASVGFGSWDDYRTEIDLSSPLSTDRRIRGRLVAVAQDSHSFIDHLKTRQQLLYGIVEADLAPSTTLSLGLNLQDNKGRATTNGHLPAFFSDGTVARFDRSTNAADVWAYRDQTTQHLFATLGHDLGRGWALKVSLGQRKYKSRELIAGMRNSLIDAGTHSLAHGTPVNRFNTDTREKNLDVHVSGTYTLLGQEHKLAFGWSAAHTEAVSNSWSGQSDVLIPDAFNWDNNATQPTAYTWGLRFDVKARQDVGYAATVLQPTDALSVILGARVTNYSWDLDGVFASNVRSNFTTKVRHKVIPYVGMTFDVDDQHTVYASFTDVFKPQAYSYDAQDRQLAPLTGKSYEVGAKGRYLGGKLNASAALFQLKQDNYAALDPSGAMRPGGGAAYVALQGVITKGFELELFGELRPGWQLAAGMTYIQPRDVDGVRVSTTQPEKTFKLATMYRVPGWHRRVSLGGSVQWQSGTYFTQAIGGVDRRFGQASYAVAGLVANVELSSHLSASFNIDNLFDKYYYAGIGNYNTVYWGTPRSFRANLRYEF